MKKYEQFVCLSGLPRSGSTLLSAILSQNPKIHSEGNSAVCQTMWDMVQSLENKSTEQLAANDRGHTIHELISAIPRIYYSNIAETEKIIIDKCRSWTIDENIEILKKYIDNNIKIIVMERHITEIANSFVTLYKKNNKTVDIEKYFTPDSEPLMRPVNGILQARHDTDNTFIFIQYQELIDFPEETIKKIYDFCSWDHFDHNFDTIIPKYRENDDTYGLTGFHNVFPQIKKEKRENVLEQNIVVFCGLLQEEIDKIKTKIMAENQIVAEN